MLAHLVEETARHAGHADILRELVDGDQPVAEAAAPGRQLAGARPKLAETVSFCWPRYRVSRTLVPDDDPWTSLVRPWAEVTGLAVEVHDDVTGEDAGGVGR